MTQEQKIDYYKKSVRLHQLLEDLELAMQHDDDLYCDRYIIISRGDVIFSTPKIIRAIAFLEGCLAAKNGVIS